MAIKALEIRMEDLRSELQAMVVYLGQDIKTKPEELFVALSSFKATLEVQFVL